MRKAWIENNTVRDICPGNPECYHPDVAALYNTEISDDILQGATLVDGVWVNPPPAETVVEPMVFKITVSPVEFKLLWSPQERAAIKALRAADPIVEDFYEIIDDPRLTFVNLSLVSTQQAVDYLLSKLVAAAVITTEEAPSRREAILSGQFQ